MFSVLRHRNFLFLWVGQLLSIIAFWMLFLALPFYVHEITGSSLATGVVFFVQTLPRVLLSSFAGVLADRWDRKKVMILTDIIRAVLIIPIFWVQSADQVWIIYVFAFVGSVVAQIFEPAKNALIPNIVPKEHLLAANGLNALSDAVTRLVGPLLGGAILNTLGLGSVIMINSFAYIVSALFLSLIIIPRSTKSKPVVETQSGLSRQMSIWREWRDGLQIVRANFAISSIFITIAVAMVAEGILNVLVVVFVRNVLQLNSIEWSLVLTAQGFGWLVGSFLLGYVGRYITQLRLIELSALSTGIIILLIAHTRSFPLIICLFGIAGTVLVGFYVSAQTLLQSQVSDVYRGRVFGAYNTTQSSLLLVGIGIATVFGDWLGSVFVISIAGCCYALAGILSFIIRRQAHNNGCLQQNEGHESFPPVQYGKDSEVKQ